MSESMPHVAPLAVRLRTDGWPLCPNCGQDELWTLYSWDGRGERPPVDEWVAAGLTCYNCGYHQEASR